MTELKEIACQLIDADIALAAFPKDLVTNVSKARRCKARPCFDRQQAAEITRLLSKKVRLRSRRKALLAGKKYKGSVLKELKIKRIRLLGSALENAVHSTEDAKVYKVGRRGRVRSNLALPEGWQYIPCTNRRVVILSATKLYECDYGNIYSAMVFWGKTKKYETIKAYKPNNREQLTLSAEGDLEDLCRRDFIQQFSDLMETV